MKTKPQTDPLLFILALLLSLIGLAAIYIAGYARTLQDRGSLVPPEFTSQIAFLVGALVFYFVALPRLRLRSLEKWAGVVWCILLGGMVVASLVGHEQGEAKQWIKVGPIAIQPSEFAKLGLILFLAMSFANRAPRPVPPAAPTFGAWIRQVAIPQLWRWAPGFLALAGIVAVELGNDLGTAGVLLAIILGMVFLGGASWFSLGSLTAVLGAGVLFMVQAQPYRLDRITTFFDRWSPANIRGTGFQTTLAEVGVADGGLWGVGLMNGIVKERISAVTTDFIFSTLAEEFGLVVTAGILLLFGALIARLWWLGGRASSPFARLTLYGIAVWFSVQGLVNFGVGYGLLPAIGIPFPFISSGGSSLAAVWLAILVAQVAVRGPVTSPATKEVTREDPDLGWWDRRAHLPRA